MADEKKVTVVRFNQLHKLKEVILDLDKEHKFTSNMDNERRWYESYKKNILDRIEKIETAHIQEGKYLIDIGEYIDGLEKQCKIKIDMVEKTAEKIEDKPKEEEEKKDTGSQAIV